jgi:methyl-accepting chemotaxis protein
MNTRKQRSLTWTITFNTAVAMLIGMGAYAVLQYALSPSRSVPSLVLEHLSHVLFIGLIVYFIINYTLLQKVALPIKALKLKLYQIASGDFRPAAVDSDVSEITEIVKSINWMQERIENSTSSVSLADLSATVSVIRGLAKNTDRLESNKRERLLDAASQVEELIARLSREALMVSEN